MLVVTLGGDETYGDIKSSGDNIRGHIVRGQNVGGPNIGGRIVPVHINTCTVTAAVAQAINI